MNLKKLNIENIFLTKHQWNQWYISYKKRDVTCVERWEWKSNGKIIYKYLIFDEILDHPYVTNGVIKCSLWYLYMWKNKTISTINSEPSPNVTTFKSTTIIKTSLCNTDEFRLHKR